MSYRGRAVVCLGMLALLAGCMPLADDAASVPSMTASSAAIAPEAPSPSGVVDVATFKSRVVGAAQAVPQGRFQLVIRTGLP
ncbi:MAG TPA: hypothetical protein VLS51_10315, partial [Propionibacteriaceae bacterium]|nr:hypothetical protein [Propionibacteriaceae bacterium]